MKKNKRLIGKIVILGAIILGLLAACAVLTLYFFTSIKDTYATVDIAKYGEWEGHVENEGLGRNCGLNIFPESLEKTQNENYYYFYQSTNLSLDKTIIYLEATYDTVGFQEEIARLSEIKCDYNLNGEKVTKQIVYDEELFEYPPYIATYCSDLSYEYALIKQEESKIVYIYANQINFKDILPENYIPVEKQKESLYEGNSMDNINIYFLKDSAGNWISNND